MITAKEVHERTRSVAIRKERILYLQPQDIDIPEKCPILGVKFDNDEFFPIIDLRDPSKDYTLDNTIIISRRAYDLKEDYSLEELRKVVEYLDLTFMSEKKDSLTGSNNPQAKLTEETVRKIRNLAKLGYSYSNIANIVKASKSTVGKVIRKEKWKHVT